MSPWNGHPRRQGEPEGCKWPRTAPAAGEAEEGAVRGAAAGGAQASQEEGSADKEAPAEQRAADGLAGRALRRRFAGEGHEPEAPKQLACRIALCKLTNW